MRNEQVREIAVIGIFSGIIILMGLVPFLGFITLFGIASITIIHIPVLIGGIFGGRKTAVILATVFGLTSLFVALTRPGTPLDYVFQNPLVSVLPRTLFGFALYEIYVFFKKVIPNAYLATSVSMVVSTFVHTILVLVPFYFFGKDLFVSYGFASVWTLIIAVLTTNGLMEMILAGLVGGPVATRLRDALGEKEIYE